MRLMKEKQKILIADPSSAFVDAILQAPEAADYKFEVARTGPETLHKLKSFEPSLLIIDLMMPHIHAIEILKTIKGKSRFRAMGVIVSSFHVMIQNYHAAIEEGADYFLVKPAETHRVYALLTKFFEGTLTPDPFSIQAGQEIVETHCYHPIPSSHNSYIKFWGTRGSNPVSGAEYVRYGGNTSCLEVRSRDQLIIIDAGTGIRPLGDQIKVEANETIHLLLSHTHWDHLTGFPFFGPLYKKNCNVVIWAPVGFEKSTKELFDNMLAYAYFPVRLDEMKARVTFKELRDHHPISIGDIVIDTHFVNHPGPTVGFKIKTPKKTFGYITDNEMLLGYQGHPNKIHLKHPLLAPHLSLIDFLKECDLIVHEAQYFPDEYNRKTGWGHSSIPNATVLLKYTGCREWIVTHHDPNHTDEILQKKLELHYDILKECNLHVHVDIAYDGLILPI